MIAKKNKSSLPLILGAVVLLIGGGLGAYWLFLQKRTGTNDLPVGANIIPQDALMAVSITTDSGDWEQLRQFGTPQTQALFDQNLAQLRDRFLTANGYNYQKDIQPWVGDEVTLAFLPTQPGAATPAPSPQAQSSRQQAIVMVLPIDNPVQAKQLLLDRPKSAQSGQWTERSYKGVQIREMQGAPTENYSATVLDNRFLVIATDPKAAERTIDAYQGKAVLSATPGYTQALGKIQANDPFANIYVNIPAAAGVAATTSSQPVAPDALAQQNQGLAATMTLEPEGVRLNSVSWLKPNSEKKYDVENSAKNMPSRLPADTVVMAAGGNLQNFWEQYIQSVGNTNPDALLNPEKLKTALQFTTGLDLEKDLLAWMGGEFSLSLVSTAQPKPTDLPAGLLLMVQTNNRRNAEKAFEKLDEVMRTKYNFKVEEAKVGDRPAVNWSLPWGGPLATHGWLDGNVAFLSLGAPIAPMIIPEPKADLATSETFQKAVPDELKSHNGNFFINVDRALNSNVALLQPPPSLRTWMSAIHTIGVTTAIADERTARYDVFVALRKGAKPGPLPSPAPTGTTPNPEAPTSPPVEASPSASPLPPG